jgi:hypothetical protein
MMESIKVRQYVGLDGILRLNIPVGVGGQEVEVVVTYPAASSLGRERSLEQLYGICADDPIVIDNQGILERLNDELAVKPRLDKD